MELYEPQAVLAFPPGGCPGWGLRGGTFRFTGDGSRIGIWLTRVRWTSDTRVSGTVWWNQVSGRVWTRLTITGPGGHPASVRLWYFDYAGIRRHACPAGPRARGAPDLPPAAWRKIIASTRWTAVRRRR